MRTFGRAIVVPHAVLVVPPALAKLPVCAFPLPGLKRDDT